MGRAAPVSALAEPRVSASVALARSPVVLAKIATQGADDTSGIYSGRRCDPRAFQRLYPDRWHEFLKAHFRNSVEVAAFFDVNEKTARLWLEGCNAPRGWAVAYAVTRLPSAAKYLLEAA